MKNYTFEVKVWDLPLLVSFDYQPAEKGTDLEPGCDEDWEVTAVTLAGYDVLDLCMESESLWSKIDEAIGNGEWKEKDNEPS